MKILFAVSDEKISKSIVNTYQKIYKDVIAYKNVYYFNALIKEIQRDKTYDRIVISEDLEPFANNNYDSIDKFLFEKLDSIGDEANNTTGNGIPIILICLDRREQGSSMLTKIFGIGIYSALLGEDRSIEGVCALINRPRGKKEAKVYYKVESEDVKYASPEDNVSEQEMQNIIAHYKRLGRNEEKYIESFESIAGQYNDNQLKIIIKYLPLNVRAVLEQKSLKYQEVMLSRANKVNVPTASEKYTPTKIMPTVINNKKERTENVVTGIKSLDTITAKKDIGINNPVIISGAKENVGVRKVGAVNPIVTKEVQDKSIEMDVDIPKKENVGERIARPLEEISPIDLLEENVVEDVSLIDLLDEKENDDVGVARCATRAAYYATTTGRTSCKTRKRKTKKN